MLRKLIGVAGLLSMFGLVVVAAPGCGSSDEKAEAKPADEDKYPDVAAFCNAIGQAECQDAVTGACASTKDACVSTVQNACRLGQSDITRNVTVSNYPYGKASAEDCIKAVTTAYTDGKIDSAEHTAVRKACERVFTANRSVGFDCTADVDCAADLGCYFDGTGNSKGTCQKLTKVGKAEDCSAVGTTCETGYYCVKAANVNACIARKPSGAACKPFETLCLENLLCTGVDEMTGMGTCADKKPNNETCASDGECSSDFCAQVGTAFKCLPAFSLGTGAPACANFGG